MDLGKTFRIGVLNDGSVNICQIDTWKKLIFARFYSYLMQIHLLNTHTNSETSQIKERNRIVSDFQTPSPYFTDFDVIIVISSIENSIWRVSSRSVSSYVETSLVRFYESRNSRNSGESIY